MTSDGNRAEFAQAAQNAFGHSLRIVIEQTPAVPAKLGLNLCCLAMSRRWKLDYDLGEGDFSGVSQYEVFPEIPDHWRAIHRRALPGEILNHEAGRFARSNGKS